MVSCFNFAIHLRFNRDILDDVDTSGVELIDYRTHRQRTQGYIKELEKEVMRLRESENQLQKQNEKYKQNAHVIELYLSQNSLAFPDGYSASTINTEFSPSIQSLDGFVIVSQL